MDSFIFLLRFIELFIMFSIIESNKFFKIEEKRSEKLIEISYRFFFLLMLIITVISSITVKYIYNPYLFIL